VIFQVDFEDNDIFDLMDKIQKKFDCSREGLFMHVMITGAIARGYRSSLPEHLQPTNLVPRHPLEGYVYFIKQQGTNYIKIGFSRSYPGKRLPLLQTGNPGELKLLGWLYVLRAREVEKTFHEILANKRQVGEWFSVSDEVLIETIISTTTLLMLKSRDHIEMQFPKFILEEVNRRTEKANVTRPPIE